MKETRLIMGMPVTVEVVDSAVKGEHLNKVFDYFTYIDEKFSTYKPTSEISRINRGELKIDDGSSDMKTILALAEQTKHETNGYFDVWHNAKCDPSGLVKGWAINNAAQILRDSDLRNFFVDAGGDIAVAGRNGKGDPWQVGIRNPLKPSEIIKVLHVTDCGVATSGTYERGQHIYNPRGQTNSDIVSLTVIGPNIYDADRFATAAFAMGDKGIEFIASLHNKGFEGYQINKSGEAKFTPGFEKYAA